MVAKKLKEVGKHSVIYGVGFALQGLLSYALIPIYTKKLSPELFGAFTLLQMWGAIASAIFYLGANSALSRSYFDYNSTQDRRGVVGVSIVITLVGALSQCILGICFSNSISHALFSGYQYSAEVCLILIASAVGFSNNILLNVLKIERKSLVSVIANVTSLIFSTGLIIFLVYYQNQGVRGAVIGTCIGQISFLLGLVFITRKFWSFNLLIKEIPIQLKYGFFAILIGFISIGMNSADKFFINWFGSLKDVGIYALGSKFALIINSLFVLPFSFIWSPMSMEYRQDKDANKFFTLMTSYYFMVGMCIVTVLCVFAKEIVALSTFSSQYNEAYKVVAPLMLGYLIYGSINILDAGILFERKLMLSTYILALSFLINILLNILLIPEFGYIGAAYVLLFCNCMTVLIIWKVSNKFFVINIEWHRFSNVIITGILSIQTANYINENNFTSGLYIKIFILFLYIINIYFFVLNKGEKNYFIGVTKRLLKME